MPDTITATGEKCVRPSFKNSLAGMAVCAVLALIPVPAMATSQSNNPGFAHDESDLKADPRVTYGVLENGLRYAIMRNSTPGSVAAIRMRIDTGSLNETKEQAGIAHFLEHMAFNGSENVPEGEMIKRLERFGLSFGADTNASTGFSQTVYKLNLPTIAEPVIDEALFLMRETASNLLLDGEAIDRERGVIASEKRTRDSVSFRALIDNMAFFTEGSGLTDRLPIGNDETIANMPREEFVKYYRGFYRPERTFILFVGDFDPKTAEQKIKHYFADWQSDTAAIDDLPIPAATNAPGRVRYYQDDEILTFATLATMRPYVKRPDNSAKREENFLRNLGARIVSRRMKRKAENNEVPYLSASVSRYSIEETVDGMAVRVRSAPDKWAEAMAAGDLEIRTALEFGFTQSEIDEQLATYRQAYETAVERANTRKTYATTEYNYAKEIVVAFDEEKVFTSPEDNLRAFETYAPKATVEAVNAMFRQYWEGYDNPSIYLSTSEKIDDPENAIRSAFQSGREVAVVKPEINQAGTFAYTEFGTPGTVVSETHIDDADSTLVKFANNVRLNFKKTSFDDGTVYVRVRVGDGFLSMPRKDEGLRRLAENLVGKSGVVAHTEDELDSIFAGKRVGARFRLRPDNDAFEIIGATDAADLADELNFMAARVTAPAFRDVVADRYYDSMKAWYPTHDSSPKTVAEKEFPRFVRSGDARYGYGDLDMFLAPQLSEVRNWIAPQLQNGLIEITVVGDIDKALVVTEVARTFGALPERADAKGHYPDMETVIFPEGRDEPAVFYHQGVKDQALVRVYWPAPDASDPANAYRMSVLRSVFRNRLTEVLREEMGATYSPGAGTYSDSLFDGYGYMFANVTVQPQMADEVRKRTLEVGEEFRQGMIDEDAFQRAVTPAIEDIQSTVENNGYWLSVLGDAQTDGAGLARYRVMEPTYRSMTLDEIKALAAQVFVADKSVAAYIMPAKESGADVASK